MSLAVTIGAWLFAKNQVEKEVAGRYYSVTQQTTELIIERMQKYEDALRAGVAAIESHGGTMSHTEWKEFANTLEIERKYPGINGIGVILPVSRENLSAFLAHHRETRPDFTVYPEHNHPELYPITYIEPVADNAAAVGLDMAHETNRLSAVLASIETRTSSITGPIVLVQDAKKTPGFLFYTPYFNASGAFAGIVYAPFIVKKLMQGVLQKEKRPIDLSISDDGFDIYNEHASQDETSDPNPLYTSNVAIDLYGRTWELHYRTDLGFRADNTLNEPNLILWGGIIIDALLFYLFTSLSRANARALSYADAAKSALVSESKKLKATNKELEQFSYIASHDLKTPIRGINLLTEIIEEDLAPDMGNLKNGPEIRRNFERIRNRVTRMNSLISGILNYARLGRETGTIEALHLDTFIHELGHDLGLKPDQIKINQRGLIISQDPSLFSSILENLIGNSKKFIEDESRLEIKINVEKRNERFVISVSDNGPGIDPRYHTQVFEVFKSLEPDQYLDSSGIGLAIVKKAVELKGGEIELRSKPGRGATFTFDWPDTSETTSNSRPVFKFDLAG